MPFLHSVQVSEFLDVPAGFGIVTVLLWAWMHHLPHLQYNDKCFTGTHSVRTHAAVRDAASEL